MAGDRIGEQIRRQAAAHGTGVQLPAGLYLTAPGPRQSATKGVNSLEVAPFEVGVMQWLAGVAISVVGTGNAFRAGIYADNGAGRPGALFLDFGQVSVSTTGIKTITSGFTLPRGLWWIGGAPQSSSNVTLSCYSGALRPVADANFANVAGQGANGYAMSGVSGALPATFVSVGSTISAPVVGLLTA